MDLDAAERLQHALASVVDYPLYNNTTRLTLSATLALSSLQFASAVRILCMECLALGASASLRSQYEAVVRSVWVFYAASDERVEKLSADLSHESQNSSKNMPMVSDMLAKLERVPQLKNLLVSLGEFKSSSWVPLNSFVHSGIHTVHWTKNTPPPQLLDTIFRSSNGLSVIAFQCLGILTGRPAVQAEVFAAADNFANVLPAPREST